MKTNLTFPNFLILIAANFVLDTQFSIFRL